MKYSNVSSDWRIDIQLWTDSTFSEDWLAAEIDSPIVPPDIADTNLGSTSKIDLAAASSGRLSVVIRRNIIDSRKPGRVLIAQAFVQLTVFVSTPEDALVITRELAIGQANAALAAPSEGTHTALTAVSDSGSPAEQLRGVIDVWSPMLQRVEKFVEITDMMSNVSKVSIE